jgi:hypothetical protein
MFLPQPTEGNFEPAPAGTHVAICYRVIDLGTQESVYNGEKKSARKVMISWEFPNEVKADGKPFVVSAIYTWSMHEKSTLRKTLEAWRGAAFTEADFKPPTAFDVRNILGKSCTLSVVHVQKGDRTYANVSSVGKAMKGAVTPALVNDTVYLWLHPDRFDEAVFNSLSEHLRTKIAGSPEYAALRGNFDGEPA